MQYCNGTTLLGQAYGPSYQFWWNGAPPGNHLLTARALDNNGATTTSAAASITAGALGNALLVVGNTTLSSVDAYIKSRLEGLGMTVGVKNRQRPPRPRTRPGSSSW